MQVEPALLFGAQTQPAVLAPGLKVVLAGTVSVSDTPVAPWVPTFVTWSAYTTVPPGVVLTPPSLLTSVRSGAAVSGVVSVELLFAGVGSGPFVPSSAIVPVLLICVTPAGTGFATVTAKVRAAAGAPAARAPTTFVQVEPGFGSGAQVQPAELPPALNVVFAGTTSVSVTPAASWLPTFENVSV